MPYSLEQHDSLYTSVAGLGTEYVPQVTQVSTSTKTYVFAALALAGVGLGYWYWQKHRALSDLGHSGRTMWGRFGHKRGYGHRRLSTNRWHFHR